MGSITATMFADCYFAPGSSGNASEPKDSAEKQKTLGSGSDALKLWSSNSPTRNPSLQAGRNITFIITTNEIQVE